MNHPKDYSWSGLGLPGTFSSSVPGNSAIRDLFGDGENVTLSERA